MAYKSNLIEVGKSYYRKSGTSAYVKRVDRIYQDQSGRWRLEYTVVFSTGRRANPIGTKGSTRVSNFARWASGCFEESFYQTFEALVGCQILPTYLVLDTSGSPVFRCNHKRRNFYLRNGYAKEINTDTIQLTNDQPLTVIAKRYPNYRNNPFFFAKKNTHCVVCGKKNQLTRHHVVPQRYKEHLPLDVRNRLSNVLFVCLRCHHKYETTSEAFDKRIQHIDDPKQRVRLWEKHFRAVMQPNHIPRGWHLLMAAISDPTGEYYLD